MIKSGRLTLILFLSLATSLAAQDKPQLASSSRATERVREPILIERSSFRLFLDRHGPTFRLEDRQTKVVWQLALDRRGFASLLLPDENGKQVEWPVDEFEDLRVDNDSVSFRGKSSRGEIPTVRFRLSPSTTFEGLEISYETDAPFVTKGGAVRLLDRGLWMLDTEEGGVFLPVGMGRWVDNAEKTAFQREFGCSKDGTLRGMAFYRERSGLIVKWRGENVVCRVEKKQGSFHPVPTVVLVEPWSLETSLTFEGKKGSLFLHLAGATEKERILHTFRQLLHESGALPSLRYKCRRSKDLRGFIGSALFRLPLGGEKEWTFDDLAGRSEELAHKLGIDRVCLIAENWLETPPEGEGWTARVASSVGGEKGLVSCLRRLDAMGHVLGLDLDVLEACRATGTVHVREEIEGLESLLTQPLLFLSGKAEKEKLGCETSLALRELAESLTERFHLLAASYTGEDVLRELVYVDGAVESGEALKGRNFYPMLAGVLGRSVRFGMRPEDALDVGDTGGLLDCLLLGEVPLYVLPESSNNEGVGTDSVFAVEDGWFTGRGLDPRERFIKTSYEVLTHVARLRSREELYYYDNLDDSGDIQELRYGFDLRIIINRSKESYEDPEARFVLPPQGFWVQHPFFVAFHATKAFGHSFKQPTLYTVRPLENKLWLRAAKVRIWRAFGDSKVRLGGKFFDVEGELVTKIW